jgi:hypothetical protein
MEMKKHKFETLELIPRCPDLWTCLGGFGVDGVDQSWKVGFL